jgi:hypothetical protein
MNQFTSRPGDSVKKQPQGAGREVAGQLKDIASSVLLVFASFTAGSSGGVVDSHGGSCACPGCLPPPKVSTKNQKSQDESGEPQ